MRKMQSLGLGLVFMALAALLFSANPAWGQDVTATITGTVSDPSGAPIVGATVTAKDTDRGTLYTAHTNEAGVYNIVRIPVGAYELKVETKGFQTSLVPSVTLALNQTARIDVQMKVGQVTQTVEVTSEAPILKTDTTEVSTIIDSATNEALPLATRNYVQLTLLSPGAVTPNPQSFNTGDNVGSGGRPFINGNREQSNNFLLDGMDNNQVSDNLLGYTPAPDAIQEFNLITQNASGEFGNFQGGIVSVSLKSGTNHFHGDVWEFFRNDKLNANSWQNNLKKGGPFVPGATNPDGTLLRNKLRWNMFGGTVGGPIKKDKLFFFFDYQGQRFDHPSSVSTFTVFTAKERGGDFGAICTSGFAANGVCNDRTPDTTLTNPPTNCPPGSTTAGCLVTHQLYNPCNAGTGVPGTPCTAATTRMPFPSNVIPMNMINPVAQALFTSALYPTPINGDTQNNAVNTSANNFNSNQYDIKIDYNISEKDRLFGRYSHALQNNPTFSSYKLIGSGFSEAPIYSSVVNWVHSFKPSLMNEFRLGVNYVKLHNGTTFPSSLGNVGETLGITNSNHNNGVVIPGLLGLSFNDNTFTSGIGDGEVQQKFPSTVIQVSDGVVITHGRHAIHTGFELWRDRINIFYSGNSGRLGSIGFNGTFTSSAAINALPNSGSGDADFFLGLPQNIQRGIAGGGWGQRSTTFAGYVQDDWRVTNDLTLNVGLRYEAHTPWVEQSDRQTNYGLFSGAIELAGKNGNSRALYNGQYGGRDFQPRLGFAWTPAMLHRKTVVRGAFTVSSYLEGTGTNLRLTLNPPWTPAEIGQVYNNVALPGTTTDQGVVGSVPGDPYANASVRLWEPNFQPSIARQWNFSIQHQLSNSTSLQVGYVGQYANHLANPMWLIQSMNPALVPDPKNPGQFIIQTTPGPYMQGNPTLKSELSSIRGTFSNAWMNYHALQAVLQKRMSTGLQGQVAYTYSKCLTNSAGYYGTWGGQASPGMPYWQNVYDGKTEKGPCFYDETHNLTSYVLYQLPFGQGKKFGSGMNKAANAVVGGWEVDGILTLHTGFAMTVNNWGDPSGTGAWVTRTNCTSSISYPKTPVAGAPGTGGLGIQWFNPGNFTAAPAATFGQCSNGKLRGPGLKNFDMGLKKDFSLGESRKLEFRSEFLNLTNTKILNAPQVFFGSGDFGRISGSQGERNIQLALKLFF
jgi:hypothetical protein